MKVTYSFATWSFSFSFNKEGGELTMFPRFTVFNASAGGTRTMQDDEVQAYLIACNIEGVNPTITFE